MGERARLLGGELKVRSMPGKGTTVLFEIPLQPQHKG
jgi:signal transduction histidine kinase